MQKNICNMLIINICKTIVFLNTKPVVIKIATGFLFYKIPFAQNKLSKSGQYEAFVS